MANTNAQNRRADGPDEARAQAARRSRREKQKRRRKKAAARFVLRAVVLLLAVAAVGLIAATVYERVVKKDPEPDGSGAPAMSPEQGQPVDQKPEDILPEPEPDPMTEDGIPMQKLKDNVYLYERDGVTWLRIEGHDMILCNKDYGLPQDFGGEIAGEAREAFDAMFAAAQADGLFIDIGSGYRSYETQEAIHNRYISSYGVEYTKAVSAEPGHSEHQTGLAADLYGENGHYLEREFETTPEFAWLQEHAAEYGFILRYQKGKTWATGYIYEPWHYRYVGVEIAKILEESGLTVEEYAGIPWKSSPDEYEGYE